MTPLDWLLAAGLAVVVANALVWARNSKAFTAFPQTDDLTLEEHAAADAARLAVCIPARNEAANIERCIRAALAGDLPNLRVLVYDDASTDDTPAKLRTIADEEPRVIAVDRQPLPEGWNGKQHALYRCAQHAFVLDDELEPRGNDPTPHDTHCLFIDADVRLTPDAARRSLALFHRYDDRARAGRVKGVERFGLLSCFPRQNTGTLAEATIVPLIFFLLLSYLPFTTMRRTAAPSASAACGQFILVSRDAYIAFDGHHSFRDSMHDGIKMPRAARRARFHTDVHDGSDAASVRMYHGFDETWRGFAKNAYEGLGSVTLLVFLTIVHTVGHVLPPLLLIAIVATALITDEPLPRLAYALALVTTTIPIVQRIVTADRLNHAAAGALVHPVGVALMTAVQWWSWYLHTTGKRTWRGRDAGGAEVAAA